MLQENVKLVNFEARKDIGAPCGIEVMVEHTETTTLAEDLTAIATDAYIDDREGHRTPRKGKIKEVLSGGTEWKLTGFRISPSYKGGELKLLFESTRRKDEFVIELWAANTKLQPSFALCIDLPMLVDPIRRNIVAAEEFTFRPEWHEGRNVLTMYCDGDSGVKYYPYYCKGDTFDEYYVVKEVLRPLKNTRKYEI